MKSIGLLLRSQAGSANRLLPRAASGFRARVTDR